MPLRKRVSYIGLRDLSYSIIDTSENSPNYFRILEFPEKFKAGKNLFKIVGNRDNLVDGCEIQVEILDYNSNPIYYEPLRYIEKDGTHVVAVYIYPDTSPGECTVYLTARASRDPLTGNLYRSSKQLDDPDYYGIPNVIWSRTCNIAPKASNDVEIIYTQQPRITITEIVQPYLQPTDVFNVFTQVPGNGSISLTTPLAITPNISLASTPSLAEGSNTTRTPSFGTQFYNTSTTRTSLSLTTSATTVSPTIQTITSFSTINTSQAFFSASMVGGTITVNNPVINISGRTAGSNNLVYPASQFNTTTADYSGTTAVLSGSYEFAIIQVFNSTSARVAQISGFVNGEDTLGQFSVNLLTTNTSNSTRNITNYTTYAVNSFQSTSNYTASYIKASDVIYTQNSASFADIILSNIEPATGDVYRIKTLYKPSGQFGDFIDLGDTIVEQTDILIDTSSLETNVTVGSYYENFGLIENLQEINTYWTGSGLGTISTTTPMTLTYDMDTLVGGMRMLPSSTTFQQNDAVILSIKPQYQPLVYKNTEYIVKFSIANDPNILTYSSVNTNIPNARLDVYVSGSGASTQDAFSYVTAGNVTPVNDLNATLVGNFQDGSILGTKIGTYETTRVPGAISYITFRFVATDDKPIDLKFVTRNGAFIIGNIQVLANQETGFSPNYVRINKRIPSEHLNTPLTFKFQFYDFRGRKADTEAVAYGAIFDGDNTYINGTNNLITGSVYIGNAIGSGVEMAGVNSAFIRSIGYEGFNAGTPGFMIWSGSVLPGSGDNYNGVGIELVTDADNYFRFRTNPSELDVHTEKFFLGSANQYVSGADGNIAISSSNFYLDASGNVTMQGTITATAGTIGGFAITSTAISSSNNSLILRGNTGEITGSNVLFTGGKIGGFTISNDTLSNASNFFISGAATSNQFFISSSRFNVKASGDVTASSALFSGSVSITGTVTATAGAIGGFVITQNALTGSGFFISGSPGNTGTGFFISSSRFNVKGNGDITGSQVLFTGGRIAGFTISNDTLSNASNFFISGSATGNQFFISASNFNVKANGDVTASSALFSGSVSITGNVNARTGNIGGFNITGDAITGSGFFLSGSATNNGTSFFISSSRFNVKGNGDLTGSQVLFTGGRVGSFVLTNDALSGVRSDTGATSFYVSSSVDTTSPDGVAFFISSSRFNVRQDGTISGSNVLFNGGTVGGFTIDSTKITGTNIIINSAGSLQTADYASNQTGWKISAVDNGFAEFENVRVRGTLKTAVFEKETVNAVGGQLYVANSTTITGSEASSSIPRFVYLKFGGYSGSNAVQNIVGSSNTYLTVSDLTTASLATLPVTTQTFKPIGSTGLLIRSGSKSANTNTNADIATLSNINLGVSASFTVMAWVYPNFDNYTTSTPSGSIIEKTSVTSTAGTFGIFWFSGSNWPQTGSIRTAASDDTVNSATNTHLNQLYNKQWTHIAMAISGAVGTTTTRRLYVNGTLIDSTNSYSFRSRSNVANIRLGAGYTYTERWPGYIADVRIYTGSLSTSQIATIYSGSYYTGSIEASSTALVVDNVTGFVNGEILSAKKVDNTGFATEYMQVRDTARLNPSSDTDFTGVLYVTRSYGNNITGDSSSLGDMPNEAQSYSPSQVIVSTGKIGTGFIRINANPNDQTTPYIDIVERTGSGIYDVKLKARLGDLSGLADSTYVFGNSNPGFGLATDNVFLQGGIIANTGSIGGIKMQDSKLYTGTGTYNDNNTGFYLGSNSYFSLGNKLSWDTSTLAINGRITANEGKIGGFEITSDAITGSGFFLSGSATGNQFFISASNFNVKANGDITASSALFSGSVSITGNINARTGNIGGFNITANAITGSAFYISGSAANNGTAFFISSSRFNVKGNGDITGSQVLFTGGTVGGFGISSTQLTASGFLLDAGAGEFELGATSFTAGDGIYMRKAGTNNFRVGNASSARMQFTGDNLEIYDLGNNRLVSLGTSNKIGGFTITTQSLAGSNFYISGSATGNQFFISASDFNVKANGAVTASGLQIKSAETNTLGYVVYDSGVGYLDAYNIGRQVGQSTTDFFSGTTSTAGSTNVNTLGYVPFTTAQQGIFYILPGETAVYFVASGYVEVGTNLTSGSLNFKLTLTQAPAYSSDTVSTIGTASFASGPITHLRNGVKDTKIRTDGKSQIINVAAWAGSLVKWKLEYGFYESSNASWESGPFVIMSQREFSTAYNSNNPGNDI